MLLKATARLLVFAGIIFAVSSCAASSSDQSTSYQADLKKCIDEAAVKNIFSQKSGESTICVEGEGDSLEIQTVGIPRKAYLNFYYPGLSEMTERTVKGPIDSDEEQCASHDYVCLATGTHYEITVSRAHYDEVLKQLEVVDDGRFVVFLSEENTENLIGDDVPWNIFLQERYVLLPDQ